LRLSGHAGQTFGQVNPGALVARPDAAHAECLGVLADLVVGVVANVKDRLDAFVVKELCDPRADRLQFAVRHDAPPIPIDPY